MGKIKYEDWLQQQQMLRKLGVNLLQHASKLKNFENLELLNEYLSLQKFPVNLVYFRAAWNPACILTDEHVRQFAETQKIEIIKVNSDVAPKISQHYGVRAEPEFVFCMEGDEVIRQIGPNYDGLIEKYQKIMQVLRMREKEGLQWAPYGSKFEKFYKDNLKYIYAKQ